MTKKEELLNILENSIAENTFVRLTLSKNKDKNSSLKKLIIKLALIKKDLKFSIVYRYQTKDITKNFNLEEGKTVIDDSISDIFLIANLFTTKQDVIFETKNNNKNTLFLKKPSFAEIPQKTHDKQKKKFIENTNYLLELGILDKQGRIKKDKGDKYKQINKFVEIVDSLINRSITNNNLTVFDMGSGKGYLTFALYDYLTNQAKIKTKMTGVEIRDDLINICNTIARKAGFDGLDFKKGFISDYDLPEIDMLIALHACDTATDDAIAKGIRANAQLIICSPCCHKQIRKQFHCASPLNNITSHGILKERQAEIVTDTIRALLLEAHAYKTKVFEFISTEHTGKNLMIVAQKIKGKRDMNPFLEEVDSLKKTFGIEYHYLEKLLF